MNKRKISVTAMLLAVIMAFTFSFAGIVPKSVIKAEAKGNKKLFIYVFGPKSEFPDNTIFYSEDDKAIPLTEDKVKVPWKNNNDTVDGNYGEIPIVIGNKSNGYKAYKNYGTQSVAGVSYNKSTNTLTLNNFNHPNSRIICDGAGTDFKVKLIGENHVKDLIAEAYNNYKGIAKVTIKGNGSLTAERSVSCCGKPGSTLTIKKGAKIKAGEVAVCLYGNSAVSSSVYNKALILKGKKAKLKYKWYSLAKHGDVYVKNYVSK